MIWGPRMQISPRWLRPSEKPVSGSITLSCAFLTTVPHEPDFAGVGFFAKAGHIERTGPASVIPYPYVTIENKYTETFQYTKLIKTFENLLDESRFIYKIFFLLDFFSCINYLQYCSKYGTYLQIAY